MVTGRGDLINFLILQWKIKDNSPSFSYAPAMATILMCGPSGCGKTRWFYTNRGNTDLLFHDNQEPRGYATDTTCYIETNCPGRFSARRQKLTHVLWWRDTVQDRPLVLKPNTLAWDHFWAAV